MKKGKVPAEASQVEQNDVIDLSLPGLDEDEGEDLDITAEPGDNVLQTPHQQRPCFTGSARHQVNDSGCQCCTWPLCYATLTLISCVDVKTIYRSLQLIDVIEGPALCPGNASGNGCTRSCSEAPQECCRTEAGMHSYIPSKIPTALLILIR